MNFIAAENRKSEFELKAGEKVVSPTSQKILKFSCVITCVMRLSSPCAFFKSFGASWLIVIIPISSFSFSDHAFPLSELTNDACNIENLSQKI